MGRRRNLFPSLGIPCSRLSADHLPLGNIQSSSLDSSIVARRRRTGGQRGKLKFTNPLPATAIPITAHVLHFLLISCCMLRSVADSDHSW